MTKARQTALFMADDPGQVDLEFLTLLLPRLPRVSRAAHLAGAALHARALIDLWRLDGEVDTVPLTLAFRLLNDVETVAGVITRAAEADGFPGGADTWGIPNAWTLLIELRACCWQAICGGTLQVEAIKGLRGTKHRIVLPAELQHLVPDWILSRLLRNGRDEFVNVRIRRAPPKPAQDAIRAAVEKIARPYRLPGARHPSFAEFREQLSAELGVDVPRQMAQAALRSYAPDLRLGRGRRW
jgi:hypothetical protein